MTKPKAFIKLCKTFLKRLRQVRTSTSTKKNTKAQMSTTETAKRDIEKEYMPHLWSTKFETSEQVLQQYISFITTESARATNSIPNQIDLTYDITGQKLDIFGTDLPRDSPILVYVHGGYWKHISKDVSRFPALSFHKNGVKTIVVGYEQQCNTLLKDIVNQVESAVSYVLNYAEENGSRGVYLVGHCSGAHIIARILDNSGLLDSRTINKLKGVFFISGLYELQNLCVTSTSDALNLAKLDTMNLPPIFYDYTHLKRSTIHFYILAAQEDSPTFKNQSRDFYDHIFDIYPTKNIYLEIKDNMDHFEMVKCLANDDNYLKKLILYDLRKHS